MLRYCTIGVLLALAVCSHAAPIAWQPVKGVTDDADVASNGRVIKAYTFGTGQSATVHGVAFQPFAAQTGDWQTLGQEVNAFYHNATLSAAYNSVLAGGVQDTANLELAKPQTVTLNRLVPGRQYQLQLWVADNRSWPALNPTFASAAQTVHGSCTDTNIPTLRWQGGDHGSTAQIVIGTFIADKPRQTLTFTPTAGFFNGKNWFSSQINALVVSDLSPGVPPVPAPKPEAPVVTVKSHDDCNLVWDSPSRDSFGSMPLGNGDVGLNIWVEETGDLVFYISKVDAFDAGHLLPKLGRVRMRFDPELDVTDFKQTLVLRDGDVEIAAGDVKLRVWVDANNPVVRVEGNSGTPRTATITVEPLRALADAESPLPGSGTAGVIFNDKADRLAWCYRNQSSDWAKNLASQNTPEIVAKTKDPILNRTSGCVIRAQGFVRENQNTLRTHDKTSTFDCAVRVLSSQPGSDESIT